MNQRPQVLLEHHLKALKLPTFLGSTTRRLVSALAKVLAIQTSCCVCQNWS
jgi:hypothetical protein